MKVCIIQPPYYADYSRSDECFEWELKLLSQCDDSIDLIVMPELCDTPCLAHSLEERMDAYKKYNKKILDAASQTAKRCNAMLFINARSKSEDGYINTTYAFNRQGEVTGLYNKAHPTPGEVAGVERDSEYSFEWSVPDIVEMEGLRFGFMTCYDFYFYEAFANLARQQPDIIIGCSHQRSDTHQALDIIGRFISYNTNAYLVRSSVSMGENSPVGGCSMVVTPDGTKLIDLKSRVGMECVDIDPTKKYYKSAGFGGKLMPHYQYIEQGRRPWKYRPGGSAMARTDEYMKYPRVCAHRGFNSVAPENSLPAYGAAVAMGADEIEFDVWFTKDGVPVSTHDSTLERVSTGVGKVYEHTYDELLQYDFGIKYAPEFEELKIPTVEDILKKFSCHTVMNIHIKQDSEYLYRLVDLIKKYDCEKYVYFMTGDDELIQKLRKQYPEIPVCCGGGKGEQNKWNIVDRAIEYGCYKVQLFKPYFNQKMIDKAHANGIKCNVFWSDDIEEAKKFIDMGIDCILTNDFNRIKNVVK